MINVERIREDFPILHQEVNDEPLVYLDNAATSQVPKQVLAAQIDYMENNHANVHRGVHTLAERATSSYEAARETMRSFISVKETAEVLFTRGTTTALNWVAKSLGDLLINEGDTVVITQMEHHSNVVPWQELTKRKKAKLVYINLNSDGTLDMDDARVKINSSVKIVSVTHASNVLGVVNPVKELAKLAHSVGAAIVVDGAQSAPNQKIDVTEIDCDFFAFSGHKMCGPTGIGILYGKKKWLEQMEPVEYGGEMIDFVYHDYSTWAELPWKFEAGTPNIVGAIGLAAAADYLCEIGLENINQYEHELVQYVLPKLLEVDGVEVYGPNDAEKHTSVISFNVDGVHPHDLATALDMQGVAVRAGHHCAQPLLSYLKVSSTARASFYFYNTKEEADRFIESVIAAKEFFTDGFV